MKKFLLWLVAGAALLLLAGFVLPRHVKDSVSEEINASPHTLTMMISSMRQFNRWSPWSDLDPKTVYTFDGPYSGVGSAMTWSSESRKVGKGGMKTTEIDPGKSVDMDVSFDGQGGMKSSFNFEPLATSTKVSWSYDYDAGNNPFNRWVGLFIKGAIKKDYVKGLAKLKAIAERAPQTNFEGFEAKIGDEPAVTLAAIKHDKAFNDAQIGRILVSDYKVIDGELAKQKLAPTGAPRAAFEPVGEPGKPDSLYKITAQMPVPASFVASATVSRIDMPAGPVLRVTHRGPYGAAMEPAYTKAYAYLKALGLEPGAIYEDYIDDPVGKNPQDVRTDIVIAVKY
jgi:Polyketide cyclase / dehydrase and lipid transport/GyrI-like small molecule binding domain